MQGPTQITYGWIGYLYLNISRYKVGSPYFIYVNLGSLESIELLCLFKLFSFLLYSTGLKALARALRDYSSYLTTPQVYTE